jgi:hypothetical protein
MGGVMTRPDVNDARRFPPSLKPETRPNAQAATSGASAKRVKRAASSKLREVCVVPQPKGLSTTSPEFWKEFNRVSCSSKMSLADI